MFMNVNEIASRVAERMVSIVDANANEYLDTDDFESLYEASFNAITEPANLQGDRYTKMYQAVEAHPEVGLAYDTCKMMRDEAREAAADAIRFAENPGKYYGVSNSDFI